MFIATTTDGLTKIGQKLLQQSVESYVYAILGAQAKTKLAIDRRRRSEVIANAGCVSRDGKGDDSGKRRDNHHLKHENSHS